MQISHCPYVLLHSIVSMTTGEFYGLLVIDWVYCRSVTVKEVANMEKIMALNFVGESGSEECDIENRDWQWC